MLDYTKIKNSLSLCNPYLDTEIEIKFSQFGQSFSSITNNQYERLLKNIRPQKRLVTYFINDHQRKVVNDNTIIQNYKTIDYIYDVNYQLHIYITQYSEADKIENYNMIKEKVEYYYKILDYTFIVSETTIKQETSYEAILKFNVDMKNHWMANLDQALKSILLILNDTNVLYTEPQRLKLVHDCNRVFDLQDNNYLENIYNHPTYIQLQDLTFDEPYIISTKSKGKRKLLIINDDGLWFVNPPFQYNLLTNVDNRLLDAWSLTVFDGEIIKPIHQNQYEFNYQHWYLAYDCLCFHGQDIRNNLYVDRIDVVKVFRSILSTYIEPTFLKFDLKTTRVALAKDEYIKNIRFILDLQENINYPHNGLIFTPAYEGYYGQVYKWTVPAMTTIDFAIYDSGSSESINLYVYDEKTKKDIPFEGTDLIPFDETMIFQEPFVNEYKNKKYIAECRWDEVMEKMVFVKIRDDKNRPDSVDMVLENWKNINKETCY